MNAIGRRRFLRDGLVFCGGALFAGPLSTHLLGANERVLLGVMGTNGRGTALARSFVSLGDVEIAAVCDVDDRAAAKGVQAVASKQPRPPKVFKDFRKMLEERDIDGVVIATPDHWHATATVLACAAGKDVYVEKPVSHNPREGELMIAAASKYSRIVQVGTQRRSMPQIIEAMRKVREGAIGKVHFARGWYTNRRGSIGRGKTVPVPNWLDWSLWQGPAPEKPYRDNIVHYNWHWFWHWGTGELGNNGIHGLDLCRWALNVAVPTTVATGGKRYYFADDQETPDTQVVYYDFGHCAIAWESRSCQGHGYEGSMFGAAFYGDAGTLVTDGSGYTVYDSSDKDVERVTGSGADELHLKNFAQCIKSRQRPNADIQEGHLSTLLCHLGNIAWRVGRTLRLDSRTGKITGDRAAMQLWSRTYRHGWELRV